MSPMVILYAPTASGKTSLALALKKRLNIEVISADSRQVFRSLNIGTAKASADEQVLLPHHCIDIVDPSERYSSGRFRTDALQAMDTCRDRGVIPLVVGGSGLYIQSLRTPTFEEDLNAEQLRQRDDIRSELKQLLLEKGKEAAYEELKRVDPLSAVRYHDRNPSRIVRALEYFRLHGRPISSVHQPRKPAALQNSGTVFLLHRETDELNSRIASRVHDMWDRGLVKEVEDVLASGISSTAQSLQSVGYKEVIAYLRGELTKQQAIEQTIVHTRQFAKRQRTWGRHQFGEVILLKGTDEELAHSLEKSILNVLSHQTQSL